MKKTIIEIMEKDDGSKFWARDGQLHRDDGPAIELADGTKMWYRSGQIHRDDGPAVEFPNGDKYWYRDGENIPAPTDKATQNFNEAASLMGDELAADARVEKTERKPKQSPVPTKQPRI